MTRLGSVCLFAILVGGCAQNGILELQIGLPPTPPGETWYAQVQIRRGNFSFDTVWMGSDIVGGTLLTESRQWNCISVSSLDEAAHLNVRVRYCRSPDCLDLEDGAPPEHLFRIERPFHRAATTYLQLPLERVPLCGTTSDCEAGLCVEGSCTCLTDDDCGSALECVPTVGCVEVVDRCSIEGCIEGPLSSRFCDGAGRHFCDSNPEVRRDATWACN